MEGAMRGRARAGYRRWLLPWVALALLLAACGAPGVGGGGEKPQTLRVGLIPNQAPDRVKAQYEPFRVYLSEKLRQPVELFVATDYNGVVEAMIAGRIDV